MKKNKFIIIGVILLVFVVCVITAIFNEILGRNSDTNYFKEDFNNLNIINTIQEGDKTYGYINYKNKKGYLEKYLLRNNQPNISKLITVANKKRNIPVKDGITVISNNDKNYFDKMFITINSDYQFSIISNDYIKIESKKSNFSISVNDQNTIYEGGFKNNYCVEIIKKRNYLLLYIYEFENKEELQFFQNAIKH